MRTTPLICGCQASVATRMRIERRFRAYLIGARRGRRLRTALSTPGDRTLEFREDPCDTP